jgi:hypothetical protein
MNLLRTLTACLLLFSAPQVVAAEIWIVADTGDAYHRELVEMLRSRSAPPGVDFSLRPLNGAVAPERAESRLVITLGEAAAAQWAESTGPVLHVFLTAEQFRSLYPRLVPQGHSALFLDQPPARYVALARAALPGVSRLILPVAVPGRQELDGLRRSALRAGLALHEEAVSSPQALDAVLERAVPERDAVLFLPDPALHSNAMMKVAIIGAYKRRIPLLAYSEGLTVAGALMSVHTTVPLLADEVAAAIGHFIATGRLAPPAHPARFELAINYQLAKALELRLPAKGALMERIEGGRL